MTMCKIYRKVFQFHPADSKRINIDAKCSTVCVLGSTVRGASHSDGNANSFNSDSPVTNGLSELVLF